MKKQSGFTLIELMVVMAIIAILATAGLSAYTGYIKKARDTTRIADIGAINTIVLGLTGTNGLPPQDAKVLYDEIVSANNGQPILDPRNGDKVCYMGSTTNRECAYTYRLCDGGLGFAVGTRFESTANTPSYSTDEITVGSGATGGSSITTNYLDADMYEIGSCNTHCTSGSGGCPATNLINPIKIDGATAPGNLLGTAA